MASLEVFSAIKNELIAVWTNTPIVWENEFTSEKTSPWVMVEVRGTLYSQMSIGQTEQHDNRWDEEGVLEMHVMVPSGTGSELARDYAKQLTDIFRGKYLSNDTIEFRNSEIASGGGDERGDWFRLTVSIDWRKIDG
jgi:hypothetical protein